MTLAYFDTSVLVKNYVHEVGSMRAREVLRQYQFLSSFITPVELMSALMRRRSMGELNADEIPPILARVKGDRPYWKLLEVNQSVLGQSEDMIQRVRMRTLDAIHVASLMTFQSISELQIPFITADARQRDAAEQVGLRVIWVR